MLLRRLAWLLLLAAGLAACDATPAPLRERARRQRLSAIGIERFDTTGSYKLAGMSTYRIIDLEPLDPRVLGVDTLDPDYDVYRMRCGACHRAPAPGSKPAFLWAPTMSRMRKNAADAGLMPMSDRDEAAVLRFLRERAAAIR